MTTQSNCLGEEVQTALLDACQYGGTSSVDGPDLLLRAARLLELRMSPTDIGGMGVVYDLRQKAFEEKRALQLAKLERDFKEKRALRLAKRRQL